MSNSLVMPLGGADRPEERFYMYTKHVNTVSNKHQVIPFYDRRGSKVKTAQSNTIKTPDIVFVLDKKKILNRRGYKNTRIEFSRCSDRSANHTTTVPLPFQPLYRQYFELIKMSHGEVSVRGGPVKNNNINFTTYFYGVCNPFSLVAAMDRDKRAFLNPVFFSSINVMQRDRVATQIFSSLTVNSQNFDWHTVGTLGEHLAPLRSLVEADLKFNRLCCLLSLQKCNFLDTPYKALVCWYNELYYLTFPERNPRRNADAEAGWPPYLSYMRRRLDELELDADLQLSHRLGFYAHKNVDLSHVMFICAEVAPGPYAPERAAVYSFGRFLQAEGLGRSLLEYSLALRQVLSPVRGSPHGYVNGLGVEFDLSGALEVDGGHPLSHEPHRRALEGKVAEYLRSRDAGRGGR